MTHSGVMARAPSRALLVCGEFPDSRDVCPKHTYSTALHHTMSIVQNVCKALERIAPLRLAEKWDNVSAT